MNTVTRAQLAEQIYMQVGLSRNESAELLEHVLERVVLRLERGESVKISGFGTFSVRQKGRRVGRNPKTGVEVPILPRSVLVFRPSQVMKARINGENPPPDEADEFEHEDEDDVGNDRGDEASDEADDAAAVARDDPADRAARDDPADHAAREDADDDAPRGKAGRARNDRR